jgi:hypothetical protein
MMRFFVGLMMLLLVGCGGRSTGTAPPANACAPSTPPPGLTPAQAAKRFCDQLKACGHDTTGCEAAFLNGQSPKPEKVAAAVTSQTLEVIDACEASLEFQSDPGVCSGDEPQVDPSPIEPPPDVQPVEQPPRGTGRLAFLQQQCAEGNAPACLALGQVLAERDRDAACAALRRGCALDEGEACALQAEVCSAP